MWTRSSAAKAPAFDNPLLKFKENLKPAGGEDRTAKKAFATKKAAAGAKATAAGAKATAAGAGVAAAAQRARRRRRGKQNAAQIDFDAS